LVQNQVNLQEYFLQNSTLIRKQTVTLQQETLANVTVINSIAFAQSAFLVAQANTNAFKITLEARQSALQNLFTMLGITTAQQKLTFIYATGLGSRGTNMHTKVIADLGTNGGSSVIVNT